MTENERDAGDEMASILRSAVMAFESLCNQNGLPRGKWTAEAIAAIKAWEDAKREDE